MFRVEIERKVDKRLEKLPPKHRNQVLRRIFMLENEPRPQDSIQLHDADNGYRIDMGDYRILYDIDYEKKLVQVFLLLNRQEGYRRHGL